jgi:hypothetical protein
LEQCIQREGVLNESLTGCHGIKIDGESVGGKMPRHGAGSGGRGCSVVPGRVTCDSPQGEG